MYDSSWKDNRYKHSMRMSLLDTQRVERWCENHRANVDDFIRDAVLARLDKEDELIATGELTPEMRLHRRLRQREVRQSNIDLLLESQSAMSGAEFDSLKEEMGISDDEIQLRRELREDHKTTLQENCEWFVKGVLSDIPEMEIKALVRLCISSGFSSGTAKRAINACTQYRRDDDTYYRYISRKSPTQDSSLTDSNNSDLIWRFSETEDAELSHDNLT